MKRALLLAVSLAAVIAVVSLRSYHGGGAQPEPVESLPQVATYADPIENPDCPTESATALPLPARESLATATDAAAIPSEPVEDTSPVRVEVLYAGTGRTVRAAKVTVGPPLTEGTTDEHGVVVLQVPWGSKLYSVRVNPGDDGDRFVPYERILAQMVRESGNEIQVRVERGTDLRGIVRSAASGAALPGAVVTYEGMGYRPQVVSDADGAFLCEALVVNPGNPGPLNIQREGYLPSAWKPQAADIETGAPPLLVLLERGITVSGRIFDSDRKPVAGAHLSLHTPQQFSAFTDDQGFFDFGGIVATEKASLYVQKQSWSRPAILERSIDLGALSASRSNLEVEVQRAIEVRVFAELPDGSSLAPRDFELDWGDGTLPNEWDFEFSPASVNAHIRLLPLGSDRDLRGSTRAPGASDRSALLGGSTHVHTGTQSPLEVHIRLSEPCRLSIPPLPPGAGEIDLRAGSSVLGALDVQVFDEDSSQPIEGPSGLAFARVFGAGEISWMTPGTGGWLRIWSNIGTRSFCVQHNQGRIERITFTIPRSGYAKTEWRLGSKP